MGSTEGELDRWPRGKQQHETREHAGRALVGSACGVDHSITGLSQIWEMRPPLVSKGLQLCRNEAGSPRCYDEYRILAPFAGGSAFMKQ